MDLLEALYEQERELKWKLYEKLIEGGYKKEYLQCIALQWMELAECRGPEHLRLRDKLNLLKNV